MTDTEKLEYAVSLIGSPWESGGRDISTGIDCYGLVCHVYKHCLGIDLPFYPGISPEKVRDIGDTVQSEVWNNRSWTEVRDPVRWSVVGMSHSRNFVHHVGLWVNDGVLHALPRVGVVLQSTQSLRANGLSAKQYWIHG